MRILHLVLIGQWYDMIEAGQKPEEYRDITPYYEKRLENRQYDAVQFRHGYQRDARRMMWECAGIGKGMGNPAWGAPTDREQFIVILGKRLEFPT